MTLDNFKNIHVGRKGFIVGKGPSLDRIDQVIPELYISGPIFCCNESVNKVQTELGLFEKSAIHLPDDFVKFPLYSVQQDSELETDCIPMRKDSVHFMHAMQHDPPARTAAERTAVIGVSKSKRTVSPWSPDAVLYDWLSEAELTANAALKLAQFMGIKHVVFCCFDSWLGEPGQYAACINKDSGERGDRARHAVNGAWIRECACQWMDRVETLWPEKKVIK